MAQRLRFTAVVVLGAVVVACSAPPGPGSDGGSGGSGGSAGGAGGGSGGGAGGGSGGGGTFVEPNCGTLADPTAWTLVDLPLPEYSHDAFSAQNVPQAQGLTGVAYGNGTFVAPALGLNQSQLQWVTSEDGLTWTPHTQTLPTGVTHQTLRKVHYQNGQFVFFGRQTQSGTTSLYVYTSSDALTWTANKVYDGPSPTVEEFDTSGALTVQVGLGAKINSSPDLTTWTAQSVVSGSYDFVDVAYGAGHWVAGINTGNAIYTSTDATNWATIDAGNAQHVEFGRGMFVAMGPSGAFATSTDGVTFTDVTPTGLGSRGGARFAGNRFLVAESNTWLASTDAQNWTAFGTHPRGLDGGFGVNTDLAFGRCRYVAAGKYLKGTVYAPYLMTAPASPAP